MKASIIMAVDTTPQLFENFCDSLSKYQTIKDYELIFVIDSESPETYQKMIKEVFLANQTKIIINETKKGYGISNNIGVNAATTDLLVFINVDVFMEPNCLEILIDSLLTNNYGAVQPLLIYPQSNLVQSTGHIFYQYQNAHALEYRNITDKIVVTPAKRQALTTALCITTKKLFNQYGQFDEAYYNAWEGAEFMMKLALDGHTCFYEPKAKAYHLRGGGRNQYSVNEKPQTGFFWTKWGKIIDDGLPQLIKKQVKNNIEKTEYIVYNLSPVLNWDSVLEQLNLTIKENIAYHQYSGNKSHDLFYLLSNRNLESEEGFIFLVDNFKKITANKLWFSLRNSNDIIIDLSGNLIYVNELG